MRELPDKCVAHLHPFPAILRPLSSVEFIVQTAKRKGPVLGFFCSSAVQHQTTKVFRAPHSI